PSKTRAAQVPPASTMPRNVIVPVHGPPPARGPVAENRRGPAEGKLVTPGLTVTTPVGAAGVPPQVQIVEPWFGAAAALGVIGRSERPNTAKPTATPRARMCSSSMADPGDLKPFLN